MRPYPKRIRTKQNFFIPLTTKQNNPFQGMKKLYFVLLAFILMGCKAETKQQNNNLPIRISNIIVRDLLDEYKHHLFRSSPSEVSETVCYYTKEGVLQDSSLQIYHLKNGLLQKVEVNDGKLQYINTFTYNALNCVVTMESKDVKGEQFRKFVIEYDQQGLLKQYTDYLGNQVDELYSYQLSPSGNVLVGRSNYDNYDKYTFGMYRDSLLSVQEGSYTVENIIIYGGTRIFDSNNRLVERYADSKNLDKKYIYTYNNSNDLIMNVPNEAQANSITRNDMGSIVPSNPVHSHTYSYVYDQKGNWIECLHYIDKGLNSRTTRRFVYN